VVGVDRLDQDAALRQEGADVVVKDLSHVMPAAGPSTELPSALSSVRDLDDLRGGREAALFLDYDGTLTPIVKDPDRADLPESMRRALESVAELCSVGIISGRDLKDIKARVDVEGITHAGSHGFEIHGPGDRRFTAEEAEGFLPYLDQAEAALRDRTGSIPGALVERKAFSIAVHFRNVDEENTEAVEKAVDGTLDEVSRLRKGYGKKVFELQPDMDWNKGKALLWILEELGLDRPGVWPVYVGDDVTDEYAFGAVADRRGLAVLVTGEQRLTEAHRTLESPEEVEKFLEAFSGMLRAASP
jgi:trehalose-phosphatase